MSYILEALKRADADRKAEGSAIPVRRRTWVIAASQPLWPWLVGGGLVLNAVVGAVVFVATRGPSPADAPSAATPGRAPTVAETRPAEKPPVVSPPIAEKNTAPAVASPGVAGSPAPARPTPPSSPTTPARPPAPQPPTAPAPRPEVAQRIAPMRSAVPPQAMDPVLPENREAPPGPQSEAAPPAAPTAGTLQEQASKLRIEVLVSGDNPKDRMVFLNGRKYVEGQALAGGAVVEQITEDGIVLVQGGERVRVRVQAEPK